MQALLEADWLTELLESDHAKEEVADDRDSSSVVVGFNGLRVQMVPHTSSTFRMAVHVVPRIT